MTQRETTGRTRGFTLIELLVVLAIIAALVGLVASALFPLFSTRLQKNTQTLIDKLDKEVQRQWAVALRQADASSPPTGVLLMAGGDQKRAQVIWIKLQLKAQFPMSYAEALHPTTGLLDSPQPQPSPYLTGCELPGMDYYRKKILAKFPDGKVPPPSVAQSSALLYLALQYPRGGSKFEIEEALGASAIKDTDGDGLPEIVDGWGNPIAFVRWGTGDPDLDSLAKTPTNSIYDRDVEDPEHSLMDVNWNPDGPLPAMV